MAGYRSIAKINENFNTNAINDACESASHMGVWIFTCIRIADRDDGVACKMSKWAFLPDNQDNFHLLLIFYRRTQNIFAYLATNTTSELTRIYAACEINIEWAEWQRFFPSVSLKSNCCYKCVCTIHREKGI